MRLQVLETYIFHSFLKDRLSRKMDSYARMELMTRSEMHKWVLTRPNTRPNTRHQPRLDFEKYIVVSMRYRFMVQ